MLHVCALDWRIPLSQHHCNLRKLLCSSWIPFDHARPQSHFPRTSGALGLSRETALPMAPVEPNLTVREWTQGGQGYRLLHLRPLRLDKVRCNANAMSPKERMVIFGDVILEAKSSSSNATIWHMLSELHRCAPQVAVTINWSATLPLLAACLRSSPASVLHARANLH